jgi:hypothetical protein
MADVFISYAREDRELASSLAADLIARKCTVWWDADILASDNYYKAILGALTAAKAAIVIWTRNSVESLFVRDEARFALYYNKLVAVKESKLTIIDIPFGFQSHHTEDISDRVRIIAALTKLGAVPVPLPGCELPLTQQIGASNSIEDMLELMAKTSSAEMRQLAARHVADLMQTKGSSALFSRQANALTPSKWSSFWKGVTFRPPKFSLRDQGRIGAIGAVVGSILLSFVIMGVTYQVLPTPLISNPVSDAIIPVALPWLLNLYLLRAFLAQRAFGSALLIAVVWLFFTTTIGLGAFQLFYPVLGVTRAGVIMAAVPILAATYAFYEFMRRR